LLAALCNKEPILPTGREPCRDKIRAAKVTKAFSQMLTPRSLGSKSTLRSSSPEFAVEQDRALARAVEQAARAELHFSFVRQGSEVELEEEAQAEAQAEAQEEAQEEEALVETFEEAQESLEEEAVHEEGAEEEATIRSHRASANMISLRSKSSLMD
jgi:hypothetical protein